ncbi:dTDP-4-dehydrorhamnose reductase [Luteibacter flocculans]|uniref:dTDP-4-dehydrorhamnose reductase n=1 Tax=Luteibacter flocculans TaxID=2780091 RepID=A0ABY4T0I2_9GAMM|nr:dTDP-4-dehydrorhamnose reductase [Luteibacter flocculans]URL57814.1 dTDP-4-dehydrorhamnose reductase [Luteibacter flocculans]
MKILLLGANGQLGQAFLADSNLAERGTLLAASRNGQLTDGRAGVVADLSTPGSLTQILDTEQPAIIINAAAYTAVDKAEQDEAAAHRINAEALGIIGAWAAKNQALVVHYSTDYVFDGRGTTPYTEDAVTGPVGAYGRSKLAGEEALRLSGAPHYIFRTAWVYSAVGRNFLRTMLRLGAERDELRVVADQYGTPTHTALIVAASVVAVDAWLSAGPTDRARLQGTYHVTAKGETTWHGFADYLLRGAAVRGLIKRAPIVTPIATNEFPTPAERPAYSVLDTARFESTFDFAFPIWTAGVDDVLTYLSEHVE